MRGIHVNKGLDYDRLRRDLVDYYGTAMYSGFPMAMMELEQLKRASETELEKFAKKAGLNLNKYR
jgi:hypothetical protein